MKTDTGIRHHLSRRSLLHGIGMGAALSAVARPALAARPRTRSAQWICTTETAPWSRMAAPDVAPLAQGGAAPATDVTVDIARPKQMIEGFGAAFSELSWDALGKATPAARDAALDMLFRPGAGLDLNLCRAPIGASDFARDWYSYDEQPGDFALRHFSIARDRTGLLPLVKAAQARRRDLRIWASPWSPPTWMKTNGHYAQSVPWNNQSANGLRLDQVIKEGQNGFIQDDRYFDAYARYFRRYVDEYRRVGVPISLVMPQNEFNSPQPYPSCCWTPEGLARFIPFLGREMDRAGVRLFLGTLERPQAELVSRVLADPATARHVRGVGVQWAGKGALPGLNQRHPALPIWGTEQECGDGRNRWAFARYAWSLMRRYIDAGATAYMYWNMALPENAVSSWGWRQNSLFTVDPATGAVRPNNDLFVLRHVSGFVQRGARALTVTAHDGEESMLAFRNPDGGIVLVVQNGADQPRPFAIAVDGRRVAATLPADSISSIVLPG